VRLTIRRNAAPQSGSTLAVRYPRRGWGAALRASRVVGRRGVAAARQAQGASGLQRGEDEKHEYARCQHCCQKNSDKEQRVAFTRVHSPMRTIFAAEFAEWGVTSS
jgi:hypothetical protein